MTLALKIQKVEFVILMILMQKQVHYIIISEAPRKAAYDSDMRTFIITRNYKDTTKYTFFNNLPG